MIKFEILEIDLKKDIRRLRNILEENPTKIVISKIPETSQILLEEVSLNHWSIQKNSSQVFIFTLNDNILNTTILSPKDQFYISGESDKLHFIFSI